MFTDTSRFARSIAFTLVVVAGVAGGAGYLVGASNSQPVPASSGAAAMQATPTPTETPTATPTDTATPQPSEPKVSVDTTCAFVDGCVVEVDVEEVGEGRLNVMVGPFVYQLTDGGRYVYHTDNEVVVKLTHNNRLLYHEALQQDPNAFRQDASVGEPTD